MRFFYMLILFIICLIWIFNTYRIKSLPKEKEYFKIQIQKDQDIKTIQVQPYALIKEVIDLDDNQYDISHLNLNRPLLDGDVIVLKTRLDDMKCISLNHADKKELMSLKGIGDKTADYILEFQSSKGFKTLEDLMLVKGVGPAKFAGVKDQLCL